jgi:hypothetical protein
VALLQAELAGRPAAALEVALAANDMAQLRAAAAAHWARRQRQQEACDAARRAVEAAVEEAAQRAAAVLEAAAALRAQCVEEMARWDVESGEATHGFVTTADCERDAALSPRVSLTPSVCSSRQPPFGRRGQRLFPALVGRSPPLRVRPVACPSAHRRSDFASTFKLFMTVSNHSLARRHVFSSDLSGAP